MPKFKIAVSWEVCGEVEVEADTFEEAIKKTEIDRAVIVSMEEELKILQLPKKSEYINGSFRINKGMSKWLNEIKE